MDLTVYHPIISLTCFACINHRSPLFSQFWSVFPLYVSWYLYFLFLLGSASGTHRSKRFVLVPPEQSSLFYVWFVSHVAWDKVFNFYLLYVDFYILTVLRHGMCHEIVLLFYSFCNIFFLSSYISILLIWLAYFWFKLFHVYITSDTAHLATLY